MLVVALFLLYHLLLCTNGLNYTDNGESKMKKAVVTVLSFGLLLPSTLSWLHVHIQNLSEPMTMILLGFGLLGLAEICRNSSRSLTHMKKIILSYKVKKRSSYDRRMLYYEIFSPERRSGGDRRLSGYKLFALTENIRLSCQE
jgi:hypothetical protein